MIFRIHPQAIVGPFWSWNEEMEPDEVKAKYVRFNAVVGAELCA